MFKRYKLAIALTAVYAAAALASAALGDDEPPCATRDDIMNRLETKYDEHVIFSGLDTDGVMHVITVSPSGSWTYLVTTDNKIMCGVAVGEAHVLTQTTSY